MRYINLRLTYLLTYLRPTGSVTPPQNVTIIMGISKTYSINW